MKRIAYTHWPSETTIEVVVPWADGSGFLPPPTITFIDSRGGNNTPRQFVYNPEASS